jgi:hypothetical protein
MGKNIGSRKIKFVPGQRVRPSRNAIWANIFPRTRILQTGVVVRVDEFNCPSVLWEGRKTPKWYHPDYISLDGRSPTPLR